MRTITTKAKATIAAGVVITAAVSGVAYAYWTTSGSGSGSASSGTTQAEDALRLTQDKAVTDLYPGGPAGDIVVRAANPAAFDQVVGDVTVKATYPVDCPADNWKLTNATDSMGTLKPSESTATVVGTIALTETGANQDACKSVTPTLSFTSAPGA
jgi:hypothetical protein